MQTREVVSQEEWLKARLALLEKEKAHSRARDELTQARLALPWVKIEKDYIFDAPSGRVALADLFEDKSQLIVQHFMFDPDWDQGCKSCSLMADHIDPSVASGGILGRDNAFVAPSLDRRLTHLDSPRDLLWS